MTAQERCMEAFRDSKRVDRHGNPVDRRGDPIQPSGFIPDEDETHPTKDDQHDGLGPRMLDARSQTDECLDLGDQDQSAYPPAELPREPVSVRYQVHPHIAEKLQRKFGLGTDPDRRRRLYAKLAEEVERHPEAERVIGDCVQCAFGADAVGQPIKNPGNWFCRAVILRLREAGFLHTTDW